MTGPRSARGRKGGRYRKIKGDQGEREVLVLLQKAGWIVMNGAMAQTGVDLIAYWPGKWNADSIEQARFAHADRPATLGLAARARYFTILHAEAKNEPWAARSRRYLGPISALWEDQGILYRVFSKESGRWWVRKVEYRDGQCRTVHKALATPATLKLPPLLMGSADTPALSRAESGPPGQCGKEHIHMTLESARDCPKAPPASREEE